MARVPCKIYQTLAWTCPKDLHCSREVSLFEGQKFPKRYGSSHCFRKCKFMISREDGKYTVDTLPD